jgi:secondary thiamine-phosphate synthase enzyme
MKVHHDVVELRTTGKGTYEITDDIRKIVGESGVREGVVTIFVQHTSCSLLMMENAAPAARRDLEKFFDDLVPEDRHYEHDDEGRDDMPAHIRMALTRSCENLPVSRGLILLGTWQGIFLFEHRRDPHRRRIAVTIVGETNESG